MNQLKENSVVTEDATTITNNNLYKLMFTNYPDVVNVE